VRCEERRERRGQGCHGEDALHVRGGQSFGVRGLRASPCGRDAGTAWAKGGAASVHAASAADSAGILSTIYVRLAERMEPEQIEVCLRAFYAASPMVRVHATPELPQIQHVVRTNYIDWDLS